MVQRESTKETQYSTAELVQPRQNMGAPIHRDTVRDRVVNTCMRSLAIPRSGELRMQKLKSHLVRTQSLNVLPLKPGVGQYITIHATLTARDFFLANIYPSGPFTCIFSLNFSQVFPKLTVANTVSCVGPQNKRAHPSRHYRHRQNQVARRVTENWCRFPCFVSTEYD